jgi:hypothetical protein
MVFSSTVKRGVGIFAALSAMAIFAAMLVSTNRLRGQLPLTLAVRGFTNINGKPHLVVCFPKAPDRPARPPFGHKGHSYATLELSCKLADGTITNVARRQDGGYRDLTYNFEIPATTETVRITKAQTVLGSFQDVSLPFNIPSSSRVFTYDVPEMIFAVHNLTSPLPGF